METLFFPKLGLEFNLNRVAFSIGDFDIMWYGVIIAIGFFLAFLYALKYARKFGIDQDKMIDVVLVSAIVAFVCARLYYVVFAFDQFSDNLWHIFDIRQGGIAIYGGILGAFITGYFMCKVKKINFLAMADLAGIGFLLGQGIGRWGNFVNIEAFGSNTNSIFGMTSQSIVSYLNYVSPTLAQNGVIVDPNLPVHPCFLYESVWCIAGFVALHFFSKHRRFDGEILLFYTFYYALGRAIIEGFRTDSLMFGPFRISQILALVLAVASLAIYFFIRTKIKKANDENYLKLYAKTDECEAYFASIDENKKSFFRRKKNV